MLHFDLDKPFSFLCEIIHVISCVFSVLLCADSLLCPKKKKARSILIFLAVSWIAGITYLTLLYQDEPPYTPSTGSLTGLEKNDGHPQFSSIHNLATRSQDQAGLSNRRANQFSPQSASELSNGQSHPCREPSKETHGVKNASYVARLYRNCYPYQVCPTGDSGNINWPTLSKKNAQSFTYTKMPRWKFSEAPARSKLEEVIKQKDDKTAIWSAAKIIAYNRRSYEAFKWAPRELEQKCKLGLKKPLEVQIQELEKGLSSGVAVFTIIDASYLDMIDDMWQMLTRVNMVERFFYVSLDEDSSEAACAAGYRVVYLAPDEGRDKRAMVYKAKYHLAVQLIVNKIDFLFIEMDVWIMRDLVPIFVQKDTDLVVSLHQNRPWGINIGIYYVRACETMRLLFETLSHYLETYTAAFDQDLFNCFVKNYTGIGFIDNRGLCGVGFDPMLTDPMVHRMQASFSNGGLRLGYVHPNSVVSFDSPTAFRETAAMHVLANRPMTSSHGKKVLAKELNMWEGANCYYCVGGERKKYISYKGVLSNMIPPNWGKNDWLFSALLHLVAMATITDRILILPHILLRDNYFSGWQLLDVNSLLKFTDWRESDFLNNPRIVFHEDTAFAQAKFTQNEIMYGKISSEGEIEDFKVMENQLPPNATKGSVHQHRMNIWGTLVETSISSADVIYVEFGTDFEMHEKRCFKRNFEADKLEDTSCKKTGVVESLITDVYEATRWCKVQEIYKIIFKARRLIVHMDCYSNIEIERTVRAQQEFKKNLRIAERERLKKEENERLKKEEKGMRKKEYTGRDKESL